MIWRRAYAVLRPRLLDALLVAVILVAGIWWGTKFVRAWFAAGQTSHYYQNYFEPAVMTACGRGFALAQNRPPLLDDFLQQRSDSFDCASLPADLPMSAGGVYQFSWYYLVLTVGTAWRVLGVSWSGLAPLFGLLFGTVLALAFGLFRLGMGRPLALIGTFALGASTSHLVNLPHLRDYAKAPFVLALILVMAWMVRGALSRRRLLALACLSGVVLGIGYGFRTDLLASIPPLLITIFLFVPGGVFKNLALKAQAAAACLLLFVMVAWPVVNFVTTKGGCQWHVALLGFSWYFDEPLGVEPASYDWGPYSDDFVWGAVGSRFMPHVESADGPSFCGPEYDRETAVYLGRILTWFPGDVATRALASIGGITDSYTQFRKAPLPSYDGPWYQWRGDALASIEGYGPILLIPFLLLLATVDLRFSLWMLCLLLWFGSLPMLQFNHRHYFHLEWIGWFVLGTLASLIGRRIWSGGSTLWRRGAAGLSTPSPVVAPVAAEPSATALRRVLTMAACCAVVGLSIWGARRLQQWQVTELIASVHQWTSQPVALERTDEGGVTALTPLLPGPTGTRPRFWVEYLRIDVDDRACGTGAMVAVRYGPPQPDLTRVWTIHPGQASILTPVFAPFSDITEPANAPGCVRAVNRAPSFKPIPVWFFVDIPTDMRQLRAMQTYAGPAPFRDAVEFARFAVNSPRGFANRVSDLALNLVRLPLSGPTVYVRPDKQRVTRPEMRRIRSRVGDAEIAYRSESVRTVDGHWEVQGPTEGPYAYLLASTSQEVEPGSRLLVTGTIAAGGLSVGMLKNGRWLDQTGVKRTGAFAVVIAPPAAGPYDIIVANNAGDTTEPTRATISSIAWIAPSSEAPERKQP